MAKLSRKYRATLIWTIGIVIPFAALAGLAGLLGASVKAWDTNARNGSNLNSYRIIERKTLSGIRINLSGITYSRKTNSLFAIVNTPPAIAELDLKGNIKRTIDLVGFSDTEGITHMHGDMFSIVQERLRKVTIAEIGTDTSQLYEERCQHFNIGTESSHNNGLEGIGWSESSGLYVANEEDPKQIFNVPQHLFSSMNRVGSVNYWRAVPFITEALPVNDISGLHVNEKKKHLLVLSQESRSLIELSFDGRILGELEFNIDPFGIFNQIDQPEGVTMDNNERIYLVGEPNIFIILDKADNLMTSSDANLVRVKDGVSETKRSGMAFPQ